MSHAHPETALKPRFDWHLGLLAVWLFWLCLLPSPAAAEPRFPAAGRVGLEPPPGMSESKRFAGFENSAQTASILIVEMPAVAYDKLEPGLTNEALATKGFAVSERKSAVLTGAKSFLAQGTQEGMGMKFDKWMLVAGNDDLTAVVTAQIPIKDRAAFPAAAIEASLRTVVLGAAKTLEQQIAALPFRVADYAGFRAARVLGGSGLMLTLGPKDVIDIGIEQPMVVVASSFGPPPPEAQRESFAKRALETLSGIESVEIEDAGFYKKGDNDRHRILARAVDTKSGETIHVAQFIRFLPRGWIRTAAILRSQDGAVLGKKVQALFESVEPR